MVLVSGAVVLVGVWARLALPIATEVTRASCSPAAWMCTGCLDLHRHCAEHVCWWHDQLLAHFMVCCCACFICSVPLPFANADRRNNCLKNERQKQKHAKLEKMVEPTLWPKRSDNPYTESLSCTFQRPSRVYPQWTIDWRMTKKTEIFLGELCNVRFGGEEEGLVGQVLPSLQQTRNRTLDTMQGSKQTPPDHHLHHSAI